MLVDEIAFSLGLGPEQRALVSFLGGDEAAKRATVAAQVVIRGPLDSGRLRRVVEQLSKAHQLLGTALRYVPGWRGLRMQQVAPAPKVGWQERNLWHDDGEAMALSRWVDQLRAEPPAIDRGELLKVGLVHRHESSHVLVLVGSAFAVDRAGLLAFIGQILEGYRDNVVVDPANLFQYSQYIEWRQSLEDDDDALIGNEYWDNYVTENTNLTSPRLACRHALPKESESDKTCYTRSSLDSSLTQLLSGLADDHGCSVDILLQGAWWLLLAKLTGFESFIAGWLHDCRRDYAVMAGAVGVYEKVLPIAVHLQADTSFAQWLATLSDTLNNHIQLQEYWNVEEPLAPAHLNVGFAFYEITPAVSGWRISIEPGPYPRFELALQIDWSNNAAELLVYADASRYTQKLIGRLLEQYLTLLRNIAENPHAPVSQLSLLSREERDRLLGFHGRQLDTDCKTISERVSEWTESIPAAPAIEMYEHQLTYKELNTRANQMAHWLTQQGVKAGMLVALNMSRSPELIIAMLAAWRAGAGYLPLEPDWPEERRLAVLADAQPQIVISSHEFPAADEKMPWHSVAMSEIQLASLPDTPRQMNVDPAAIAYVLYTSGSTGKPKGVVIEHRHLLNYVAAASEAMNLGDCLRWALISPIIADVGNTALFGALFNGACLVIADNDVVNDAYAFSRFIHSQNIAALKAVPSHLEALLEVDTPCLPSTVILGGEAPSLRLIERMKKIRPDTVIFNHYGPTETTVGVLVHQLDGCFDTDPIPLTRVLANNAIYVLDEDRQLVPSGGIGEIFIGGAQLCRGYLGRDAKGVFENNPFQKNERLYRSGDLAYVLPEGGIRLAGRSDHQVNIRGFRVEPAEVESVLQSLPGVQKALVIATDDHAGEKSLAAFVAPVSGYKIDESVLRESLLNLLPSHMCPTRYVTVEDFPLLANGKVNRMALASAIPEKQTAQTFALPRNETDRVIADCMADLLERDAIGIDDNFFHLGAHSLLAIKLAARLRTLLKIELAPSLIFDYPSVMELADYINNRLAVGETQSFIAPPNGIPDRCDAIRPEMVTLVELTREEIEVIEQSVPGGAANIQDIYPLVPLQEGILFHHLLSTERDTFVSYHLLSFDTKDRLENFVKNLNKVVARHDILRTAVLWENLREPVQVVFRQSEISLEWLSPAKQDAFRQKMAHPGHRIDVRKAPLMHCAAMEDRDGKRWLLHLFRHHLVADHTALELQIEEITLLQLGRENELPKPLPFRHFVAHSRSRLSRNEHEIFFRKMLGDVEEPTAPFNRVDTQGDGGPIGQAQLSLTTELATQVRQQAQRFGVGASAIFHLAWALVVGKTSGKNDVVFGTVLFGRMQGGEGSERAMGMFVNTLPLRMNLQGVSVAQALPQTHSALIALLRHEHVSLTLAQRCSALPGGAPLFSTLLNYRYSAPTNSLPESDIWEGIQVLESEEHTNYPITLTVDDLTTGFNVTVQVSESLNAQAICDYVQMAVQGIVTTLIHQPEFPVSELDILSASERTQLRQWGVNAQRYSNLEPVHRLFEQRVMESPDSTALIFNDTTLSYRELNGRSNRLAHYLIGLGVKPETRVGIAVERSVDMLVGLLGILKAGAAYVPLDPEYPRDRLTYMIDDSGIELLLTQSHLREIPRHGDGLRVLELDNLDLSGAAEHNPQVQLHGESVAYVIYTSGSTGKPKGVTVRHEALCHFLLSMQQQPGMNADDILVAVTSLSFDIAALELYLPLISGAQIVLASREEARNGEALCRLMERTGATVLQCTPASWRLLLASGWSGSGGRPFKGLCGGEALQPDLAWDLRRIGVDLWNLYGPTETTIWSATGPVSGDVNLGRAIAGTQLRVLDAGLNPVPIGVAGELYLGGIGLARGYLHRPALTSERFIADPFDHAGGRLYRTADLVRWTTDGRLEYLGRIDHQVKIRGFRIELGEIETQLLVQPEIREAVVIANESPRGCRLVGHVVATTGREVDVSTLRERLSRTLPDYMVPSTIVVLDAIPLNANGKVDRKALPEPDPVSQHEYEPPQGEVEEILARIWVEVLGVKRVGRHDNFFELGGHSLLVVQATSLLAGRYGCEVPVRTFFEAPQLWAFASRLQPGCLKTDDSRRERLAQMDSLMNEFEV